MKVERKDNRIASMEMALDELKDLSLDYFQSAEEMNVIITKRLQEQQIKKQS